MLGAQTRRLRSCTTFPQDDKDLVHEFVQNDGLACLIKVGSESDQNYQNYILRGERLRFPREHALRCTAARSAAFPSATARRQRRALDTVICMQ